MRPLHSKLSGFNFWRVSNNFFVQKILMRSHSLKQLEGVFAYPYMVITPCSHPIFNKNSLRTCLTGSRLFRFDCLAGCFFYSNRGVVPESTLVV